MYFHVNKTLDYVALKIDELQLKFQHIRFKNNGEQKGKMRKIPKKQHHVCSLSMWKTTPYVVYDYSSTW